MRFRSRARLDSRLDVDTVEERLEGSVVDFHVASVRMKGFGDLERVTVEPLLEDGHPGAIEKEDLQRIATSSEKDQERAAPGVVPGLLVGKTGEPIEASKEYTVAGWASINEATEGPAIWDVVEEFLARNPVVTVEENQSVKVESRKI